MSGWDNIDPMAGKVASQINGFANAPVFWDLPKDRAVALAIVNMVREECAKALWAEFTSGRFDKRHLALGDILLTIGEQERITSAIKKGGASS